MFDSARLRVYVVVADNRGSQWWEPVLLSFKAPAEDPVLETSPLGDEVNSMPEFDVPLALTMGANGRMWMSSQELEDGQVYTLVSEIDPANGTLLGAHDLRDLGLGHSENNSGFRSLHEGPVGGLVWVGAAEQNYLLALDDAAQLDCVVGLGGPYGMMAAFTGSDGGLHAAGFVEDRGGRRTALVRVR